MVIIPNENDLLKLSKMQKKLCNILRENFSQTASDKMSDNNSFVIPALPLWLLSDTSVDLSEDELKNEGKSIISVVLQNFCIEKAESYIYINCSAKVNYTKSNKQFFMPFIIIKTNIISEKQKKEIKEFFKKEFPLPLKIFRLGIEQFDSPNTKSIRKSVWCKLK